MHHEVSTHANTCRVTIITMVVYCLNGDIIFHLCAAECSCPPCLPTACESAVILLFDAVMHLGCKPYLDSQRETCICQFELMKELWPTKKSLWSGLWRASDYLKHWKKEITAFQTLKSITQGLVVGYFWQVNVDYKHYFINYLCI